MPDNRVALLEQRIERLERIIEELLKGDNLLYQKVEKHPDVVASYDFSDENCRLNSGWKICNAETLDSTDSISIKAMRIERTLGVFCDPMLINDNIMMQADGIKKVHVRLKSNVDATQRCMLRVYFTTEKYPDWSQTKSVDEYYPAGRKVDVFVDMKNRYWNGNLKCLRIDPVEGLNGSIEIELIELLDAENNVKYSVDFTRAESLESTGWTLKNTSLESCNGKLMFNADLIEKKKVYTDPYIVIDNLDIDASVARYIHVKMRTDIENKTDSETYMQVLFKTKSSDFWTQDKSMRYSYRIGEEIDAYIEVRQLFWKGTLIALRIDPFENSEGKTEIRMVELLSDIPKNGKVEFLEARTRQLEDRFIKIYS